MRVRVLTAEERTGPVKYPYDNPDQYPYLEPGKEYGVALYLENGYTDAYGYHDEPGVVLMTRDPGYPWVFDMVRFEWVS